MSDFSPEELNAGSFANLWLNYTDKKMELESATDRIKELETELTALRRDAEALRGLERMVLRMKKETLRIYGADCDPDVPAHFFFDILRWGSYKCQECGVVHDEDEDDPILEAYHFWSADGFAESIIQASKFIDEDGSVVAGEPARIIADAIAAARKGEDDRG